MGKSYFVIPVSDMNNANTMILNHLQNYKFKYLGQYNIVLDGMNLTMTGYKCQSAVAASFIEYAICNNNVYMFGYANSPQKPLAIDDNSLVGGLAKTDAISKIMPLVQSLQSMSAYVNQSPNGYYTPMNNVVSPTNNMALSMPNMTPPMNNMTQNTINNVGKTTNTYAIVSLIIGIIAFFTSFFGATIGMVIVAIGFYLAAMGMKLQKNKGMCIVAIVILSIDVLIDIIVTVCGIYIKLK